MSGEMVFAIGYGLVMVCAGGLTWWGVRKFYDK